MPDNNRIVADGRERVRRACMDKITDQVRANYAGELAKASFFRRFVIRIKIRRDIQRELRKIAPNDAHYLRT